MTSRERVITALRHQEADRLPFDLGGMAQSGINKTAYVRLRRYLGLPEIEPRLQNVITQIARVDDDFVERLGIDTRIVYGQWASDKLVNSREEGDYLAYTDEWGIGRRKPKTGGLYYDVYSHPFDVDDPFELWDGFAWPDPTASWRFEGMREEAKRAREQGKFVVLMGLCPGVMEVYSWLRGFERFYTDLAADHEIADRFIGKVAELKIAYWQRALAECEGYIDAVNEADDLAGQDAMLMSPATYREVIKPHHRKVVSSIKKAAPGVKVLFHSCGAIRPIIPDLIEIGVDMLNPVQISAADMDPFELKRDFGKDICFWGGGIDTQHVLSRGTPQQIADDVKRNIEALAPGGGFVFAAVHAIQAEVPPENIMMMWETMRGL
ncbi:MAG: hypothetical protein M1133_03510 [Armatimonadetes bacterium]|nr:hypothetical protein [Armatimonadota bacterium]